MKRILILSVGGSPEPIINAIKFYKPDFVYFFCSSGPKGSAVTVDGPGGTHAVTKGSHDAPNVDTNITLATQKERLSHFKQG